MDRRSLLKMFGAGAAVVPLIGGVPEVSAAATLIEVPKLQPLVAPSEIHAVPPVPDGQVGITVTITDATGSRWQFDAQGFVTESRMTVVDVTTHSTHSFRQYIPGFPDVEWNMRGRLIAHSGSAKMTLR